MVIIDGEKYACERCIRGHRVSTCAHENAPLTHIKPKGRPATQCQHCRDSRRTGNIHIRCSCGSARTGKCQCKLTSKCVCSSKAKPKIVEATSTDSVPQVALQPTPPEEGLEIELAAMNNENARASPFQTWYPRTAEAYNRLPAVVSSRRPRKRNTAAKPSG